MAKFKFRREGLMMSTLTVGDGGISNYTTLGATGNITTHGTAKVTLTSACFGGASNKTSIQSDGDILQGGTAAASLGDTQIGSSGSKISELLLGTFSPSFGEMLYSHVATAEWAVPGITAEHQIWLSPCGISAGACTVLVACCPVSGSIRLTIMNTGCTTVSAGDTTCPWGFLAIKAA